MNRFLLRLCIIPIVAIANGQYPDILDLRDRELLENREWFETLHHCLMEIGPCPDDVKIYASTLPVYIRTQCDACSSKERELFEKYGALLAELYPEMFAEIAAKFSPKSE